MSRWVFLLLVCVFLQSCTSIQLASQFEMGKLRYSLGDYKTAFYLLLPVAQHGNPQAEYAVGYMFYYGYGVTQNTYAGMYWMNKAAQKNYACARRALELIYEGPSACFGAYAEESFGPRIPFCALPESSCPLSKPPCPHVKVTEQDDIVFHAIEKHACLPLVDNSQKYYKNRH